MYFASEADTALIVNFMSLIEKLYVLVHQTTSRVAQDFYTKDVKEGGLRFDRPFSIVQFNRSDQRVPYFFFQLVEGKMIKLRGVLTSIMAFKYQ